MKIQTIELKGKSKKKLSTITKLFSDLEFSKIKMVKGELVVEKSFGKNLEGTLELDYRVIFSKTKLKFEYSYQVESKRSRDINSLKTFLNILVLVEDYYDFDMKPIISSLLSLIADLENILGKKDLDLTLKIDELESKNSQLKKRYQDLVVSSEENARLLIEAERRNDEIKKRLDSLEGMSDQTLKEELFKWIKLHGGSIDVSSFSNSLKIPPKRVEQGLNLLIKEGYIKKK